MRWTPLLLAVAACAEGDCPPLEAEGDGLRVVVTAVDGCGGGTWNATVSFPDGRSQTLAGERDGAVTAIQIQDVSGDTLADIVILAEPNRRFEFIRQGDIFFGREIT